MKSKFLAYIKDKKLISDGDSIIVALSGGADSMVLFTLLLSIREEMNLKIYAAHLNHMIRGTDAFSDMNFVKNQCEENKVQLFTEITDVRRVAKEKGISEELAGRQCRYDFFSQLSEKLNAKVATAHTSSDNVETVLFNLTRGSAIGGMTGIPVRRDYVIRPLLIFSGNEIRNYANNNNIPYCIDRTNYDDKYTRNKIRNKVVPVLREINPELENSIGRYIEISKETQKYLEKTAKQLIDQSKVEYGYDTEKLSSADDVILKNAVVLMFLSYKIHLQYKHVNLICDIIKNGGALDISDKLCVVSSQGIFRITQKKTTNDFCVKLSDYKNKEIIDNIKTDSYDKDLIDINSIDESTVIRHRRPEDVFRPVKRKVNKSLRKLMNELKIPSELRDELLVVANKEKILWVENIGTSEYGTISADSKSAVKILGEKL